jgi:hypothetical protein
MEMSDELPSSYSLLCSECLSPCSGADAHVLPSWNPQSERVVTVYRCENCWLSSLAAFRAALIAGGPDIRGSFCDFLERHRFRQDAARLRVAPLDEQLAIFLQLLAALGTGRLILEP